MDEKQSGTHAVIPTYEPPSGATPGHMATGVYGQAPQGQPQMMSPQSTGQTVPPYGSPSPMDHPYAGQQQQQQQQLQQQPQQQGIPLFNTGQPGQQVPQQGVQHQQSMYQTAMPLVSLTSAAAPVDCPVCKTRALTRIQFRAGNATHGWAALACICLCLGCIPYLINSLKDCEHYCTHCGTRLAVWHSSGRTVVEAHG